MTPGDLRWLAQELAAAVSRVLVAFMQRLSPPPPSPSAPEAFDEEEEPEDEDDVPPPDDPGALFLKHV